MAVTADVKKYRNYIAKNSRRRLTKAIVSHRRATRRAEKQALKEGDSNYRRRSFSGYDVC